MRNLKRVLTLVMAVAMMMSLLVVGAGAAFPDQNEIKNTEAVNMNVALGIINGRNTGEFDPTGNVTRAEMAKMITIALNGGKEPTLGTKATASYKDTKGHWAEAYIEYCTTLGIVAGMGDGTFAPNASVTGTQAAKMLLVCLGYDAEKENFNGAKWSININVRASQKDLYEDLAIDPNAALIRDDAAQMVYNSLHATKVEYEFKLTTVNGALTTMAVVKDVAAGPRDTILKDKFKAVEEKGILSVVSYNKDTKEYTYTVSGAVNAKAADLSNGNGAVSGLTTKTDFTALYGQQVKVIFTRKANGDTDKVYGIYGASKNVLETTVGEIKVPTAPTTDKNFKIGDTKYELDNNFNATPIYTVTYGDDATAGGGTLTTDLAAADKSSKVIFVSNDDNKDFNYAVIIPVEVAKVTFVGKDNLTARLSYSFKDDEIVSGIAKDDYVKIVKKANSFNNKNSVSKLDVISGKVEATRTGEARINGTWYTLNTGVSALELNATYDASVIGTIIYNADKTSGKSALTDVILVTDAQTVKFGTSEAKAFFADGTSQIINISKVADVDVSSAPTTGLYTFNTKAGKYEITAVTASNKAGTDGYDGNAGTFADATDKLGNYVIADDAVIYVAKAGNAGFKVYTGAQAKTWADFGASSKVLYNTVRGLNTVQVAFITSANSSLPSTTGDTEYGYVTSKPEAVKIDDDTYFSYTIWTKSGSKNVLDEDGTLNVAKGDVISFKDLGGGKIDTTTPITSAAAIKGVSGDYLAVYNANGAKNTVTTIDKDTVIIYVNSSDVAGVQGGSIEPALQQADGSYILNAWVVARAGATTKADLIVFDVNNDIDDLDNDTAAGIAGYAVTAPTKTVAAANGITIASIVANKTYELEGESVTYTVTYSGTASAATTLTFTAGTNSTVPATATVSIANLAVVPAGTTVTFVVTNVAGAVGAADASVATTP